jgi:hypothetical protein
MSQDSRKMLQLIVPPSLQAAVKLAADREMTSISEFTRRVLIERLRADGIDPATAAIHSQKSDHGRMEARA